MIENPQVREWVEDQRRKLADLLRTFGDQLDPRTRSTAEAYAFRGVGLGNGQDLTSRRESQGAQAAAAVATGVATDRGDASRRYTRRIQEPDDAAERRRMGRDYLARRNQEMLDRSARASVTTLSRHESAEKLPQMQERARSILAPQQDTEEATHDASRQGTALIDADEPRQQVQTQTKHSLAARYANPFSDEHELFHSPLHSPARQDIKAAAPQEISETQTQPSDLGFEDQLARALSLSLAESEQRAQNQQVEAKRALDNAIAASIEDAHPKPEAAGPLLVDLQDQPQQRAAHQNSATVAAEDDLYSLTPQATGVSATPASNDGFVSMTSSGTHPGSDVAADGEGSVVNVEDAEVHSVSSDDEPVDVLTPDSWSEVGSRLDEDEQPVHALIRTV